MTPEQARLAAELFENALELPSTERPAFVEAACREPAVRQEVETLLAADAELEAAPWPGLLDDAQDGSGETSPRRLGAYSLVRKLGEGGMSTVYLALHADGESHRRVAVKLMRQELLTAEIMQRFELERQILASLDHPAIAKLLDAGHSEHGVPFFVMEYIEGEPIDGFCERHLLTVNERLGLICRICSAVHYAHQNLVVHRDIKPSNLLVTTGGEPKLLDFGIAKVMNPQLLARQSEPTKGWERLLTPEYASPEQMLGQPITTVSDVYSLGVLLFKVLTGRLPFDFAGRTLAEIENLIALEEPPKPSAVVGRGHPRGKEDRGTYRISPYRIEADLDAIVAKAMRKEPQRRYASAEELAGDLRRYLGGSPVNAHCGNWRYHVGKLLKRHRVGVGMTAAAIALTLTAAIVFKAQSGRLAEQRGQAVSERERALAITSFVERLFGIDEPDRPWAETITTRALLESAVERVEEELAGQPETQADLLAPMGSVFLNLGLYEPARHALEKSLRQRETILGPGDERVAESLASLGLLEAEVGRFETAEGLYRRALETFRQRPGVRHDATTVALVNLGTVVYQQGRAAEAEALLRRALAAARQGGAGTTTATALDRLGQAVQAQGRPNEAEELLSEALELRQGLLGPLDPAVAETLNNLALVARDRGDRAAARRLLERAGTISRTLLGDRHVTRALTLNNLAVLAHDEEDFARAALLFRESLGIARDLFPRDYPQLAYPLLGLGSSLLELGEVDDAEPLLREAVELRSRALPPEHPLRRRAEAALERCRRSGRRAATAAVDPWAASTDGISSALVPRTSGWCVPDGGFDDTLTRYSCCSGVAVQGTTTCPDPEDRGTTWTSCSQVCGTRLVDGCIPAGGVDAVRAPVGCCGGHAVPGSIRCLDPADYGTTWRTCIHTCA